MSDFPIFANHAHLYPAGTRPGASLDDLKRLLDECGIEKCVCFAPFPDRLEELTGGRESLKWIENEIRNEPALVGFGTLDFKRGDLRAQVREAAERGLKGLKIHPAVQEIAVTAPALLEVYDEAQSRGLFISFHTGLHWHRIADYQILLFDEVAWRFPLLRFSMEHVGGSAFFRQALLVMCNNEPRHSENGLRHVYAGWTSIAMERDEFGSERRGPWSLTDDELCDLVHQTGPEASIFGLDFPFKKAPYIRASIDRVLALPISDEAKAGILGGNLQRVLTEQVSV